MLDGAPGTVYLQLHLTDLPTGGTQITNTIYLAVVEIYQSLTGNRRRITHPQQPLWTSSLDIRLLLFLTVQHWHYSLRRPHRTAFIRLDLHKGAFSRPCSPKAPLLAMPKAPVMNGRPLTATWAWWDPLRLIQAAGDDVP